LHWEKKLAHFLIGFGIGNPAENDCKQQVPSVTLCLQQLSTAAVRCRSDWLTTAVVWRQRRTNRLNICTYFIFETRISPQVVIWEMILTWLWHFMNHLLTYLLTYLLSYLLTWMWQQNQQFITVSMGLSCLVFEIWTSYEHPSHIWPLTVFTVTGTFAPRNFPRKVPFLELSPPGAKVLWNFRSWEQKFHRTFAPRSERSVDTERKFWGLLATANCNKY